MKEALKDLPNLLTLGNLACGAIGMERAMGGDMQSAFICILIAAVLDFFDGFAARLLGVTGEMGKQLDSLADLVTFGVLPGILMYYFMMQYGYCKPDGICTSRYAWMALPAGAAWRLARFNISPPSLTGFTGVPVPIMGIAFASLVLCLDPVSQHTPGLLYPIYSNFYFLALAPVAGAWLMVSELPMMAFKFGGGDKQWMWKVILLVIWLLLILLLKRESGIPVLLAYVFISILANFARLKKSNG